MRAHKVVGKSLIAWELGDNAFNLVLPIFGANVRYIDTRQTRINEILSTISGGGTTTKLEPEH